MALWQTIVQPTTVEQALQALAAAGGAARPLAGGTDLLLDLQQGRHAPLEALVDLNGIPELCELEIGPDQVRIGAAVTHSRIVGHEGLRRASPALVEACGQIGGPQVRNTATLGGNVAHALPAGDGSIALLALEAEAQIAGPEGRRWLPVEDLFAGPGQAAFDRARELLVAFRLRPNAARESSAFRRVMRPQGVAIAILNMAAWVRWGAEETMDAIRLALGPAGPRPLRARAAEEALRGRRLEPEALDRALEALAGEAKLRASPHRATLDYRRHLLGVLLRRTLEAARQGRR